jgi:hypothetical protein
MQTLDKSNPRQKLTLIVRLSVLRRLLQEQDNVDELEFALTAGAPVAISGGACLSEGAKDDPFGRKVDACRDEKYVKN